MVEVDPGGIPSELAGRDQWICWRTECRDDDCGTRTDPTTKVCPECGEKTTKRPVQTNGRFARSTDASTWGPLSDAIEAHRADTPDTDGVGFVFDGEGLIAGIDLDDCRDPETGDIEEWAAEIVESLDSFTEVSPSGTGLHVYTFGFIPEGGNKTAFGDGEVEMYDSGRYFTVTGEHVEGTPEDVNQRQDAIKEIHREVFGSDSGAGSANLEDFDPPDDVEGDFELYGHVLAELRQADPTLDDLLTEPNPGNRDDTSESDFETCIRLLHYGFEPGDVHGIMRKHRNRGKLLEDRGEHTYLERTIREATKQVTGNAEEPVIESRGDPDKLAFWKLRQAAVAHGVLPPDAFVEQDSDDGEDTYLGFPGGGTYNRVLDALAESGIEHGREKAKAKVTDGSGAVAASGGSSTGDVGPESPDGPGDRTTWEDVRALFDSDANGTTTKGYAKAVEILERDYTIVTIRDSEAIYFYDETRGFYLRKGHTFIRELIERHLGDAANENRKREILSKWRDQNFVDVDDFEPPKGKVNVENGVLDLDEWAENPENALEEHTPEYYFTNQLHVEYNPDAEGGLWVDQLERAVGDSDEIEKIEQFIGYCLETWHHEREKNMFFVGKSRTGKSTIQEAIQALFGEPPTVTTLTPQQLADTKFDAASLFEAALNTVNDINASKIEDSGTLKRIFSGERTKMENKYEDHFFAEPNAKHLFTANWLPRIVATDEAIWRRILIIEFTDQLTEEEKDRSVKRQMKQDPEVRQVMFNRALEARTTLNEQDHFTADRSMKGTRELWDSWRTNNKRFLYSHFEVTADPDDEYEKRTYWQAYNEWCAEHGYEPASNRSVTKELSYVPGIGTSDDHHYTGLRWAEEAQEQSDDPGQQTSLGLSQAARKEKVRSIINEIVNAQGDGAPIERVIGHAEAKGLDADQVENDIEEWLKDGTLTEAGADEVYFT